MHPCNISNTLQGSTAYLCCILGIWEVRIEGHMQRNTGILSRIPQHSERLQSMQILSQGLHDIAGRQAFESCSSFVFRITTGSSQAFLNTQGDLLIIAAFIVSSSSYTKIWYEDRSCIKICRLTSTVSYMQIWCKDISYIKICRPTSTVSNFFFFPPPLSSSTLHFAALCSSSRRNCCSS